MTILQLLKDGGWPVHGSPVLAPEDLLAVREATTLVEQCMQRCRAIDIDAHERARLQIEAGFQRGVSDGAMRCAERLLQYERAHDAAMQQREKEVLALVMTVLERLAPALARGELIRTLVRQAVTEARQARRLLVKVHPDHVASVEQELVGLRANCTWLETLEVIGTADLAEDDCILESPNGFINAGWTTQLAAVRQVLQEAAG
jgi:flagellar assembly protein FliH